MSALTLGARLADLVPELIERHHVPGISVSVVEGGVVTLSEAYGIADAESGRAITTDAPFHIASLSKPMIAFAVMGLVEKGKLDLDKPLVDYLDEGQLREVPQLDLITGRMALSHTCGLWNNTIEWPPVRVYLTPGHRFSCSGQGYTFLQKVISAIAGSPLAE